MSGFGISGLASGIDWSSYISAVRQQSENAIKNTLLTRQTVLAKKSTTYQKIRDLLSGLNTQIDGFTYAKDFKSKTLTSSDEDVVTGVANLSAIAQTATIRVDQLATNEVWTGQFSSVDGAVTSSDQTLTINVRGTDRVLNVAAGTTLTQLADLINEQNWGISATVYDLQDGSADPARIAIVDSTSGKANPDQTPGTNFNLSITSTLTDLLTADFGASPTTEGKDAKFYLNGDTGTAIYRDTNTITDIIAGVDLTLHSTDNTEFKTLTVVESTKAAKDKIDAFIKAFNEVFSAIAAATAYNPLETVQSNPTASDPTLRNIMNSLTSSVTSSVTTLPQNNAIKSLSDIGVGFSMDQKTFKTSGLVLDEAKFNAALAEHYDDVVAFFEGVKIEETSFDGFGQKNSTMMDSILRPYDGLLVAAIDRIGTDVSRIDKDIQAKLDRIQKNEEMLTAKFARLETQLARLNSQGNALLGALGLQQSAKK